MGVGNMSQIVNWICLISVTLLVLDIMIYFCNDAIKAYNRKQKLRLNLLKNLILMYIKKKLQNKK